MRNKKSLIIRLIVWVLALAAVTALVLFVFVPIYSVRENTVSEPPEVLMYEGDGSAVKMENEHLLFIDKPAGISVHDGPDSVAQVFSKRTNNSLSFVSAPLHRLDQGTSGLLAVSKSAEGARWFCKKIKDHEIKKFYLGIALGRLEAPELWEDEVDGKAAKTIATPLKNGTVDGKEISLVQYQIFTGRKRQIRAQSAAHGHPLLGDKAFGAEGGRFYLRSMRMEFPDNDLGLPPFIDAPEPQDFLAFFK